jgi:hypothetical protein
MGCSSRGDTVSDSDICRTVDETVAYAPYYFGGCIEKRKRNTSLYFTYNYTRTVTILWSATINGVMD